MSRIDRVVLLAALCLASALVGVELMATSVALPAIVVDLADWTQLRRASWAVNGYLLAYIAVMPLAGRAADRIGLPRLLAVALIVFAIGSLAAGAADTLDTLVLARVVQGLGGGAILPLATAGASHLFQGAARGRALGLVSGSNFLGMALGPFLGATVLESFDLGPALLDLGSVGQPLMPLVVPAWRWVFYLGAPAAIVVLAWCWAATARWDLPRGAGRIDLLGGALVTTTVASGLIWVTALGEPDTGSVPWSLVAGLLCVVAAVLAARHLTRTADPFLDTRLFRDDVARPAMVVSLLTGYALATAIIASAVWVDRVRYGGPAEQRLFLGTLALSMAVGAIGSGYLLRRIGVVPLGLAGLGLAIAGSLVLGTASQATPASVLLPALALFGLGFGLTVTPRSSAAIEALGRAAYGTASAAVTVARMVGMAVGLAVLTAFGTGRIEALSVVLTDGAARDAVLPPALRGRPLADPLVVDVLEAWAADQAATILASLFLVAAVVLVVAVVPTIRMGSTASVGRARSGDPSETIDGPRDQGS
ncbi:MAG: MFS transporter [Chloroflexi bacterium]|nr:MFS transporter [Chloroflexota bacterium]